MRVVVFWLTLVVQASAFALTVTNMSPLPGGTITSPAAGITITFSAPPVMNNSHIRLQRAGADGVLNTADDLTIIPALVNLVGSQLQIEISNPPPNDLYQITLVSAGGPAGLAAHWKFDESGGTALSDASGNNNTGTLTNGPVFNTSGGVDGGALSFDGTDDYVEVPSSASLTPSSGITVATWAYITDPRTGNVSDLIRKADPINGYTLRWSNSSGRMEWTITRGNQPVNPPTLILTDTQANSNYLNGWHHFAGTFDGATGTSRFYVDGVERISGNAGAGNLDHSGPLWMMWTPPGAHTPVPGKLDEARIYNRALSAAELQHVMSGGIKDGSGNALDGSYPGSGGGFPSGNGTKQNFVATFRVNAAPVATPQSVSIHAVGAITLSGSDADSDPLTYSVVTPPQHGALSGTAPNLTYTPAQGFGGSDSFTFKVNDGFADSAAATVNITITNQTPVVSASASPLVLSVGETVAFSSQGSDPDGDPLSYTWDFGDGTGFAPSANPTHTYTATGTYTVVLTVGDGQGGSAQATLTVRVGNGPEAAFTIDTLAGFVGQKLAVDGSLSRDPNNALVSYLWRFGDDSDPATGVGASHVYTTAGMQTITLTVTDAEGLSDTLSRDILILPASEFGKFDGYVKYAVKFDRSKSQADSVVFEANVNLGRTKVTNGTAVAVELAGRRYAGELDAKLRDKNGKESWQVLSGSKKQSAGAALIKLKVSKTSLGQQLVDAGVTPGTGGAAVKVNVPVRIEIAGHVFEVAIATEFKFSKDGKKAAGKGQGP